MKILFWKHTTHAVSGSDEQMFRYATELLAAGHRPSVLLFREQPWREPHPERLRKLGVPVRALVDHPFYLALRLRRKVLRQLAAVVRIPRLSGALPSNDELTYQTALYVLRRCRPDLIHVLDPREGLAELLRAARAARVPVLYHELRTPRDTPEADAWYTRMAGSLALCARVAALSPRHARVCRDRLGYNGPISVLPLLVERPAQPLEKRDATSGRVVLGYSGNIDRVKGLHVLLEALSLLRRYAPDVSLWATGQGPHLEEMKARAAALGLTPGCEFLGAYAGPEQRTAFLRGVDVFVLPSFAEGTPRSIIEAMAHGLPVVASAVGGIPDVVTPDLGLLVPAGDAPALAEALRRLAADPGLRAAMGVAARKRYEQLFAPEVVLPVLLDTYRRVARRKPADEAPASAPSHPWTQAFE